MIFELLLSASLAVVPTMEVGESAQPNTAQMTNSELLQQMLESDAELKQIVDDAVAELVQKGDAVEGWNDDGVELETFFRNNGGSFETHVLLDVEEPASIISYQSDFEIPGITHWMEVKSHSGPLPHQAVVAMASNIFVGGSWHDERLGTAYCTTADTISLGSDQPIENLDFDRLGEALMMVLILMQMDDMEVCSVFSIDEEGYLVENIYDRSGRPYATLNSFGAKYRLVTRDEAVRHLKAERNTD